MSAIIRDLWPDDINADDVISPEEILDFQAKRLEERTNGLLVGHVVKLVGDDRVLLAFEVEAPRAETRVRLFSAQHRPDLDYPVALEPPSQKLPEFLQSRVYYPGIHDIATAGMAGQWVENDWIASSPIEFAKKVEAILSRSDVKSIVLSLQARATRSSNGDNGSHQS